MWLKSQVALYRVSLTNYPLLKRNKAKQRIILSWTPWIYLYESYVSKSILNRWVLSIGVRSVLRTQIPDLLDIHIFCRESCVLSHVIVISNVTNSFPASDWSVRLTEPSDWRIQSPGQIRVKYPDAGFQDSADIMRSWISSWMNWILHQRFHF